MLSYLCFLLVIRSPAFHSPLLFQFFRRSWSTFVLSPSFQVFSYLQHLWTLIKLHIAGNSIRFLDSRKKKWIHEICRILTSEIQEITSSSLKYFPFSSSLQYQNACVLPVEQRWFLGYCYSYLLIFFDTPKWYFFLWKTLGSAIVCHLEYELIPLQCAFFHHQS